MLWVVKSSARLLLLVCENELGAIIAVENNRVSFKVRQYFIPTSRSHRGLECKYSHSNYEIMCKIIAFESNNIENED